MTSTMQRLHSAGLIKPPAFVVGGTQYEVMTGSGAYGVSTDRSDVDLYGWCFPPREMVFPHLAGEIQGFGNQIQRFQQFQQHHIDFEGGQYDVSVYNIVKYFQLCMENNPNMIDTLFVPQRCVLFITPIGDIVRENRKAFLHRGAWHKFKGYAFAQMKKLRVKDPEAGSRRRETVDKFGYDVKFAYHVVRLMEEVRQIMVEGDLNIERNSEQLKSIRRGEWTLEQLEEWFAKMELGLEETYNQSKLPWGPTDGVEERVKVVLLRVLEQYYGSLQGAVAATGVAEEKLGRIRAIVES